MLRFSDGITLDTSGVIRRLELSDGLYVIGQGYLIPCKTEEDVQDIIKRLTK